MGKLHKIRKSITKSTPYMLNACNAVYHYNGRWVLYFGFNHKPYGAFVRHVKKSLDIHGGG